MLDGERNEVRFAAGLLVGLGQKKVIQWFLEQGMDIQKADRTYYYIEYAYKNSKEVKP